MKLLKYALFLLLAPSIVNAGLYYDVVEDFTTDTASETIVGSILISSSIYSTSPSISLDGVNNNVTAPMFTGAGTGLTSLTPENISSGALNQVTSLTASSATITSSDFSVGTSSFVVKNGSVGVGTTTPTVALHVIGDIRQSTLAGPGMRCMHVDPNGVISASGGDCGTGGSGTISGSGSTNYIPKFTNGTTLGDSLIYDNGTGLGIGTTNPDSKLDIAGSIKFSADTAFSAGHINIMKMATNGLTLVGVAGSTNDLLLTTPAGVSLIANPTGTNNVAFSGGNVGIWLNDPKTPLEVSLRDNVADGLRVTQRVSGTAAYGLSIGLSPSGGDPVFSRMVNDVLSEVIRIQRATGNVGIGKTNPGAQLDVNGSLQASSWKTQTIAATGSVSMGGFIIKWGLGTASSNVDGTMTTITFGAAFPSACTNVQTTCYHPSSPSLMFYQVYAYSASAFTVRTGNGGNVQVGTQFFWMAIGY